jgi:hypothetical protein
VSFVFRLLSLLAAAIQELIAAAFALRAATLERGLGKMLEDDAHGPTGATGRRRAPATR